MSSRNNKPGRRDLAVKIISIILAGLMILSVAYLAILFIIDAVTGAGAADETGLEAYAVSCGVGDRDFYVTVAIQCGSSSLVSYGISAPYGFVIGEVCATRSERSFTPLFQTGETDVNIAVDANLTVGYQTCSLAATAAKTDIGCYHVELEPAAGTDASYDIWQEIAQLTEIFGARFEHVFPCWTDGARKVRIGAFPTYALASEAAAEIGNTVDGFVISVASPTTNGMLVLNEDFDEILFEWTGADDCCGAICAVQSGSSRIYLNYTSINRQYDGVFFFRRYISGSTDGFSLINLVRMLEYCEGVVASEIFPSWDLEALKAFAITVNSFTISNRNKQFSSYGCDFIASSTDQNYKGRTLVNDNVIRACEETRNQLLSYQSTTLVSGYYTSSQGGCSVDTQYVWGGNTGPYICSQATPWEDYTSVPGGFWKYEVSPTALCTAAKKYTTALTGTRISSVQTETTGDSTYVYRMTFTDNKGKTDTVTRCSKITGMLSSWCRSANLVIGKNKVTATYEKVQGVKIIDLGTNYSGNLTVKTAGGQFNTTGSLLQFFSSAGQSLKDASAAMYVRTAEGTAVLASEKDIPISTLPDAQGNYTYVSDYGSFLIVSTLREYTQTYTAETSGNFVIVGKGYGHGVGLSAYGLNHLAKWGAKARHILGAYFPGTDIIDLYQYWQNVGLAR